MKNDTLFDRKAVEDFLFYEARLLDDRDFETWRDLFLDDGYYWVPLRPDQSDPASEVSMFYDTKDTMRTRIERLRHARIHSQLPFTRTCRAVNNVSVESVGTDDEMLNVGSNLIMVDYRQGAQRVFAAHVKHCLKVDGLDLRISWKKVDLINCDDVHEVIAIPF